MTYSRTPSPSVNNDPLEELNPCRIRTFAQEVL